MCAGCACLVLYWSQLMLDVAIEYVFRFVLRSSEISGDGFFDNLRRVREATGSGFIPVSTCCLQHSSVFALLSVYLCGSILSRAAVGAINLGLLITDSVIWAIVWGELTTFLTMHSINNTRAAYRWLSTPLCWAVSVSSTSLVIASPA